MYILKYDFIKLYILPLTASLCLLYASNASLSLTSTSGPIESKFFSNINYVSDNNILLKSASTPLLP